MLFTLARAEGGRGISDIRYLYNNQIEALRTYFHRRKARLANTWMSTMQVFTIPDDDFSIWAVSNVRNKKWFKQLRKKSNNEKAWPCCMIDTTPIISTAIKSTIHPSCAWLIINFSEKTETFLVTIRDQVIDTNNYQKYIIKNKQVTENGCMKCHENPGTIHYYCRSMQWTITDWLSSSPSQPDS